MIFRIAIDTDNAAFQGSGDDPQISAEVARCIGRVIAALPDHPLPGDARNIRDTNGNTVGYWRFEEG